ncbi:type I restriction-modification system subunit M [Roseicyclus mahoneyensis]|uniref:Uncharacterized protein n=1 Tax=Roseicyclus mahoneyensis TaxID=164332 RepID=A0A316G8T0_9RHOB|nr:type I restriction-modification system subunit M [Roseicyclus mahoneyensis]PWK57294.1 hypothetical protein C7455_11219 [Roseicyclus mahoneyensis]
MDRLVKAGLHYQVTEKFTQIDLQPDRVDNHQMALVFAGRIRRPAELSNETAGEHFTPPEVRLLAPADRLLAKIMRFLIGNNQWFEAPRVERRRLLPMPGFGSISEIGQLHPASQATRWA